MKIIKWILEKLIYSWKDGACEYLTLADEDWDNQDNNDCTTLTNECINYLSTLEK